MFRVTKAREGTSKVASVLKESPLPIKFVGAVPTKWPHLATYQLTLPFDLLCPIQRYQNFWPRQLGCFTSREQSLWKISTSPLELWDYMATDRPISPNLPSIREIQSQTNRHMLYYEPDEPIDLLAHLETPFPKREKPFLRSWSKRARELSGFLSR